MRICQFKFPRRLVRLISTFTCFGLLLLLPLGLSSDIDVFNPFGNPFGEEEPFQFPLEDLLEGPVVHKPDSSVDRPQRPVFAAFESSESLQVVVPNPEKDRKLAGWFLSPWSKGKCREDDWDEHNLKKAVSLAASSTAHELGMQHFAVESCWREGNNPKLSTEEDDDVQSEKSEAPVNSRKLEVNKTLFPHGIESAAQFAHEKGLLFGLGLTVSSQACPELEPSRQGVTASELVGELNSCSSTPEEAAADFMLWGEAAKASVPSLVLICSWSPQTTQGEVNTVSIQEVLPMCDEWVESNITHTSDKGFSSQEAGSLAVQLEFKERKTEERIKGPFQFLQRWRWGANLLGSDPLSTEADRQRRLALDALLGRQLAVRVSSFSDFLQQTSLIEDRILLTAISDPQHTQVKSSSGPGGLKVMCRDMADGDLILGLFNLGDEPLSVAAAAAELVKWCQLQEPAPLKLTRAWNPPAAQQQQQQQQQQQLSLLLPPGGAGLVQAEFIDPLGEKEEAKMLDEPLSLMGIGLKDDPRKMTVAVLKSKGSASSFTAAHRLLQPTGAEEGRVNEKLFKIHRRRQLPPLEGFKPKIDGGDSSPLLSFFRLTLAALLPLALATALGDEQHTAAAATAAATANKTKGKTHPRLPEQPHPQHHHNHPLSQPGDTNLSPLPSSHSIPRTNQENSSSRSSSDSTSTSSSDSSSNSKSNSSSSNSKSHSSSSSNDNLSSIISSSNEEPSLPPPALLSLSHSSNNNKDEGDNRLCCYSVSLLSISYSTGSCLDS
ncbi:alpha-galactosidase A, putative [Eimeria praecox]|uniref:Alpha-galactosidase A, putative n=1 Tax=Eimeria praecox TaxID=51316 RepID=U6G1Z2_9EIME|nr:alpha-galactosidase A, putative [Eimeria praecox]